MWLGFHPALPQYICSLGCTFQGTSNGGNVGRCFTGDFLCYSWTAFELRSSALTSTQLYSTEACAGPTHWVSSHSTLANPGYWRQTLCSFCMVSMELSCCHLVSCSSVIPSCLQHSKPPWLKEGTGAGAAQCALVMREPIIPQNILWKPCVK